MKEIRGKCNLIRKSIFKEKYETSKNENIARKYIKNLTKNHNNDKRKLVSC